MEKRVLPLVVVERAPDALKVGEALREAGLNAMEIAFRTEAAAEAIGLAAKAFPDMAVGAGTVLSTGQLGRAVDAGAAFIVSPGLNAAVSEAAGRAGVPYFPGVATPTEIERAMALGHRTLKFFPAEALGGVKTLKAIAGPYAPAGIRMIPTGGVNDGNAAGYLALPLVAAVGASWMTDTRLVAAGDWAEMTRRARHMLALAAG
ncbi:MAG: bifunctional 4-hydroxy-2-oxoglutarate aldolase/2-dehydro-3-deoxy-phosphogluconate aldolase [Lentisphaerae bacterium]|nr:bifunctional 4-hydroxy-2-oxoglutarate aldolase/2-dehydro-3-deoxy-phosphogluconate aldolase [Lentisphaerota bacterium]